MAEILYDAALTPDQITFASRSIPTPANLTLTQNVPQRTIQSDKISWGEVTRRNRMAKYRAYDGAIARAVRDEAATRDVALAPFSTSLVAGEYETLQKQYALLQGGNKAALVNAILDDIGTLTAYMQNRVEMALGQVLSTGKFTVNENRTMFEADYGVPAENFFTAAAKWIANPTTAKAGDDLRAMRDLAVKSGMVPGRIWTSTAVVNALLRNAQVVGEAIGTQVGRTYLTRAELQVWLGNNMLPTQIVEVETAMYDDEAGTDKRVFPQNLLVLTPESLAGVLEFVYGISATAFELVQSNRSEMTFGQASGIVGMIVKDGPPFRQFTYTDAIGMPILYGARQVVIGSVG